jgi:hypothetical protein
MFQIISLFNGYNTCEKSNMRQTKYSHCSLFFKTASTTYVHLADNFSTSTTLKDCGLDAAMLIPCHCELLLYL